MDSGEQIRVGAGYPALTNFAPGEPGRPLVVFVTGGGVLARIAYGFPGGRPEDFLAYWLSRAGYPFLAISYPIDNPVFDSPYPAFSVRDWGEQTAEIIEQVVAAAGLPRTALVLAWSMAGRIAEPLNAALKQRGIAIELFVAMSASTALPGLLPGLDQLKPSSKGLARVDGDFVDWLLACLHDQNARAGRTLIDDETFRKRFTGDLPVNLAATALRYRDGAFDADPPADADDVGAVRYSSFPPLALITHASPLDFRHALTDRATWGFYITQTLCERRLWPRAAEFAALPPERWRRIVELVNGAPGALGATVSGNHLFFVGEPGARETVAAIDALRAQAERLEAALDGALGQGRPAR
jgi:hypothetical protein